MKSKSILRLSAAVAIACAASAHAADLTWDGAVNNNWNTTDANWTGSTWNNATPDNAIFNNTNSSITLTEAITGGSLSFSTGGTPTGAHTPNFSGSSLSLASIYVSGGYNASLGNGGVDNYSEAYNQRLQFQGMNVNVSGDATVGRGMLYVYGGATLNVSGTILANSAWNVFRADDSTVTATGGIDFSSVASQVELYGGTVTTPFVKAGNATWLGSSGIYLSGVTLVATQDSTDYIQVYNDGNTSSRAAARIYGSGLILNSNGHAVTINNVLFGDGFLTKTDTGTLTLAQTNTYTGNTSVNAGTLEISATGKLYGGGYIYGPVVTIDSGATLRINEWNYDAPGSLGDLDFSRELLVINGGTIEYAGNSNDGSNPGAAGRNFVVGTGGATIKTTTAGQTWTITDNASYGALINNNGLTVGGAGDGVIGKVISGAGSLTKTDSGTWTLTGANTYTGDTTVDGGTLSLTSTSLDNASAVAIASGAKIDLNFSGYDVVGSLDIAGSGPLPAGIYNSSNLTYGSYFTGTGSLLVLNDATGVWASLSSGFWDDPANWQANTIASGFDQSATFNAATGVTVTLNGPKTIGSLFFDTSDYTIAGPSALTLDSSGIPAIDVPTGRTATVTATINGFAGMEKTGAGTLVLTAANTYSGGTTVNAGTLILDGASGGTARIVGDLTVNSGATVALANGDTTGLGYNGGAKVTSLTINGGTVTTAGVTHIWNYPGGVDMTGGTLQSNNGVSDPNGPQMEWINADVFTNASADTATVGGHIRMRADGGATGINFTVADGAAATDLLVSAAVTEASAGLGITKDGAGTMVLDGTNTYTGNTEIYDGTLQVTAASSLSFAPTTNGATNKVTGASTATLSFLGTVNLDLATAEITNGNTWTLFSLTSYSGLTPAAITSTAGTFGKSGTTWTLTSGDNTWSFEESTGVLSLAVAPANDYLTWGSTYGLTAGSEGGDLDNDGLTNFEEYAFGLIPNSGSSVNPIAAQLDKATGIFSYTRRDINLQNPVLTYTVWYSTDLATWTQDAGAVEGTPVLNGEVETVPVTISGSLLTNPKLFIQVRAQ